VKYNKIIPPRGEKITHVELNRKLENSRPGKALSSTCHERDHYLGDLKKSTTSYKAEQSKGMCITVVYMLSFTFTCGL